jgi:hypothetical protein
VQLDLKTVRLNVNAPALDEGYHAQWGNPEEYAEETTLWRAEIPLSRSGQSLGRLEISGARGGEAMWVKIAVVAKVLEEYEMLAPAPAVQPSPLAAWPLPAAGGGEQVPARRLV